MQKIFHFFIEAFYWLFTFLSPVLASALIASLLYFNLRMHWFFPLLILSAGFIGGIIFAERVRRKHGSSNYWAKVKGGG